MEKMNLARNVCKEVYSLRIATVKRRLRNSAKEFSAVAEGYAEVMATPNIKKTLSSPKEAEYVREVHQLFRKSVIKLGEQCDYLKKLEEFNLLRTRGAPTLTITLVGTLLGAFAYKGHLNEKYQALEKELSAENLEG